MKPEQLARLLDNSSNKAKLQSPLDVLDERELEIFSILSHGYTAGQIESEFGIKRSELKSAKDRIQGKLQLKNEVELIQCAARHGRESGR